MYKMAPLPMLDELERLAAKPRGTKPYAVVKDIYGDTLLVYSAWATELSPTPEDPVQDTFGLVIEYDGDKRCIICDSQIKEVTPYTDE